MTANNPANAYLRTKVMTASREELRLLLLDGALKFAQQGRGGLVAKNYEQSYLGITQCRDIVLELLTTIRPEPNPKLAERVKAVYAFLYTTLVEASMERSIVKLDQVIKLLEYERETWVLLMQQLVVERAAQKQSGAPETVAAPGERTPISIEG
jgi:flagellar secretion chaperone FliS